MVHIYNPNTKQYAQNLRKNMTPQEKHLWYDFLRSYPVQFYRQKQFGEYITDFYCAKAKLVIEHDGGQHFSDEALEYDKTRTGYLESLGILVLRYNNLELERSFRAVCEEIDRTVRERTSSTAACGGGPPSPKGKA